ncbi:unnamed protein product [Blepharisma stoltei]|uniref:Uncharacterized protein n=1 Tax=Blepharisma stoltei TaxID=1481888 RepID=A0AAU9KSA6_9CILI|nr:unnamed protein product [Blepharisma stoltei]
MSLDASATNVRNIASCFASSAKCCRCTVWQLAWSLVQVGESSLLSFSVAFGFISWLDPWLSLFWKSWLRISGSVIGAIKSPSELSSCSMMLFCIAEAPNIRIRINTGTTIYFY